MVWDASIYQLLPIVAAALSVAVIIAVWDQRANPDVTAFILLMVGVWAWSLTYVIQIGFTRISDGFMIAYKLGWVGAVIVPTTWLVFAIQYTRHDDWLSRPVLGALSIEPLITLVFVATNPNELVYQEITMTLGTSIPVSLTTFGPWYWINLGYSYLLIMFGLILVIDLFVRGSRLYRKQAGLLLFGAGVPLGANALFVLGADQLPQLDPTPFAFAISGLIFAVGLFHFDLLDRTPVARRRMSELFGDAFVVVDDRKRIVDYNVTAGEVFDGDLEYGVHFTDVFVADDLQALDGSDLSARGAGDNRVYHIRCSPIREDVEEPVGFIIGMHNVTGRKAYEQRLEVANRLLRHNLRNEANLILGHAEMLEERVSESDTKHVQRIEDTANRLEALSQKARHIEETLQVDDRVPPTVDVARIVESVVDRHRGLQPGAKMEMDVPESATTAAVDRDLLEIAIDNIVENAFEHTDQDPEVEVRVTAGDPVRIAIADNGPGIPEIEHAVLEAESETPLHHGSGIGLWLVHWIISASDGRVFFEENEPNGTVVTIELPAA